MKKNNGHTIDIEHTRMNMRTHTHTAVRTFTYSIQFFCTS